MATDDKHNREAEQDEADKLVKELAKEETGLKNAQRFLIYLAILLVVLWILFFKIIGITHMPTEDMSPRIDCNFRTCLCSSSLPAS